MISLTIPLLLAISKMISYLLVLLFSSEKTEAVKNGIKKSIQKYECVNI